MSTRPAVHDASAVPFSPAPPRHDLFLAHERLLTSRCSAISTTVKRFLHLRRNRVRQQLLEVTVVTTGIVATAFEGFYSMIYPLIPGANNF